MTKKKNNTKLNVNAFIQKRSPNNRGLRREVDENVREEVVDAFSLKLHSMMLALSLHENKFSGKFQDFTKMINEIAYSHQVLSNLSVEEVDYILEEVTRQSYSNNTENLVISDFVRIYDLYLYRLFLENIQSPNIKEEMTGFLKLMIVIFASPENSLLVKKYFDNPFDDIKFILDKIVPKSLTEKEFSHWRGDIDKVLFSSLSRDISIPAGDDSFYNKSKKIKVEGIGEYKKLTLDNLDHLVYIVQYFENLGFHYDNNKNSSILYRSEFYKKGLFLDNC